MRLVRLVPICLESNTENTEQVATLQIYCCLCDSNSQYTLNFGEWPECASYPQIQAHSSTDYNVVATQPLPPHS